jgi:hypothetical protein
MPKVLYNNSYGIGFSFSDAFIAEYEGRVGKKLDSTKALFYKGADSIRCDPIAIAIFEEKGSEWCSGEGSSIALRNVHPVMARYWEIEETEGDEYVRIMSSEALADILHAFMLTNDRTTLDKQYAAIMEAVGLKPSDVNPSNDNGYIHRYFSVEFDP